MESDRRWVQKDRQGPNHTGPHKEFGFFLNLVVKHSLPSLHWLFARSLSKGVYLLRMHLTEKQPKQIENHTSIAWNNQGFVSHNKKTESRLPAQAWCNGSVMLRIQYFPIFLCAMLSMLSYLLVAMWLFHFWISWPCYRQAKEGQKRAESVWWSNLFLWKSPLEVLFRITLIISAWSELEMATFSYKHISEGKYWAVHLVFMSKIKVPLLVRKKSSMGIG